MDKKSKTLLAALLIITVASLSYTFYKTVVKQSFEVVNTEDLAEEEGAGALDESAAEDEAESPAGEEAEASPEEAAGETAEAEVTAESQE